MSIGVRRGGIKEGEWLSMWEIGGLNRRVENGEGRDGIGRDEEVCLVWIYAKL